MEIRKITGKTVIILIGLFLIQAFFFLYSIDIKESVTDDFLRDKEIDYDEEYKLEQAEYVSGYKESIDNIVKQVGSLGGISIFAKKDSFSSDNLEKTKNDFIALVDVEPIAFNDIFIKQFFNYTIVSAFAALAGIFVAFSLVDGKKKGLRLILHSSKRGRLRLSISKISVLFLCSVIISALFYIGNLIVSAVHFDGDILGCLSYPIQSVSSFAKFPYAISIGGFLVCYVLCRALLIFLIGLIVWLIMFCTDNQMLSLGISCVIAGVLYVIYKLVGPNSPVNYLRYCNIWYLMEDASFFTEYRNLNWYEKAVNKDVFILLSYIVILIVTLIIAAIVSIAKYPVSSKVKKKKFKFTLIKKIKGLIQNTVEKMSVGLFEFYKTYIKQKGILVIAVFGFILFSQVDAEQVQRYHFQEMYYEFMEEYEGPMGEEAEAYITELENFVADLNTEYSEAAEAYENGKITSDEWAEATFKYYAFENERLFLNQLHTQRDYLNTVKEEKDIDVWYVNVYGYNHLFTANDTIGNVGLIVAIVLLSSGLFAFEKKSSTCSILRGSRDGRNKVFMAKLRVAVISTVTLFMISTLVEVLTIYHVYGLSGFAAPAQSLYMLDFVPFNCSIGTFVVLMYLTKGLVLVGLSIVVSAVSMVASQKQVIVVLFVLCVPALLTTIGLTGFEKYSIISVMSIGPMLIRTKNILSVTAILVLFIVAGVTGFIRGYRKWCTT